jgi:hypothetical protein
MLELASVKREEVEIPFFNSEVLFKCVNNYNLLNFNKTLTDYNGNIFNTDVLKILIV